MYQVCLIRVAPKLFGGEISSSWNATPGFRKISSVAFISNCKSIVVLLVFSMPLKRSSSIVLFGKSYVKTDFLDY